MVIFARRRLLLSCQGNANPLDNSGSSSSRELVQGEAAQVPQPGEGQISVLMDLILMLQLLIPHTWSLHLLSGCLRRPQKSSVNSFEQQPSESGVPGWARPEGKNYEGESETHQTGNQSHLKAHVGIFIMFVVWFLFVYVCGFVCFVFFSLVLVFWGLFGWIFLLLLLLFVILF